MNLGRNFPIMLQRSMAIPYVRTSDSLFFRPSVKTFIYQYCD